MRNKKPDRRVAALKRGAALVVLGSLAAGCSSSVSRFTDSKLFTGSTANQQSIIKKTPEYQPYPGDVAKTTPSDGTYTGSVNREALKPVDLTRNNVSRGELAPVSVDDNRSRRETTVTSRDDNSRSLLEPAGSVRKIDPVETGAVVKPDKSEDKTREDGEGGWTATGGTQITLREGETLYNLSRRFGVPIKAIQKVNGINDPANVAVGRKIVIPTYVYSRNAPVSAPDNNPKVAKAKSSRGEQTETPAKRDPKPAPEPAKEAVLPAATKSRERTETAAANEAKTGKSEAATGSSHKVVSGDTLYDIARKYGTTTERLMQANGLSNGFLKVGQVLKIPAAGETVVADAPDGVDPIVTGSAGPAVGKSRKTNRLPQYTPPVKKDAGEVIEQAKAEVADTPDDTGVGKMRWPARGRIVAGYGSVEGGRKNDGIDIALPSGTPIKASENGVVIYAGDGLKEFGNTVLVRHEDGLVTVYGYASKINVSRGDKVKRGQEIARSGMSGAADVPKLHFEVRDKSVPVDPMTYLQ